jgi:hypothetical protein
VETTSQLPVVYRLAAPAARLDLPNMPILPGQRRHTSNVWVKLEGWLIQDGQITEPRIGGVLRNVGLRANCRNIAESDAATGTTVPVERGAGRAPGYHLTGVVAWARPQSSALLDVGDFLILAEPDTHRVIPHSRDAAMEPYSPTFHIPDVGTRASITGTLEAVGDYEWDAFGLPDARRDWQVSDIRPRHQTYRLDTYLVDLTPTY